MSLQKKIYINICLFLSVLLVNNQISLAKEFKKNIAPKSLDDVDVYQSNFKAVLNSLFPKERINIQNVKNSVVLSGNVTDAEVASRIEKVAIEYFEPQTKILNFLHVKTTQQVMLRVKVGEVIKSDKNSKSFSNNDSFENLERNGLIRRLAEPNLTAISGEKAEFLAGGEIPVPVMQREGVMSVSYKPYGVKVVFSPIVLSSNRIRLSIEPEVSEIIAQKGDKLPMISSRKVKTTVELAPGETFMVAGLVKDYQNDHNNHASELIISVTPYLVNPMQSKDLRLPTDNMNNANVLEAKFIDKVNNKFDSNINNSKNASKDALQLEGPVGFMSE